VRSRLATAMTTTIDLQAYVAPAMELVYEAGTPAFRGQWPKIEAMLELAAPVRGTGDWTAPYLYLPSQPVRADAGGWPRPALPHGVELPEAALDDVEPGVLHDNPRGRLRAMDRAGVACQVISPGQSIEACIGLPSTLAAGVLGAYNRYILSYCAYAPDRLKAVLQVHAGEPHWSAREIEELARHFQHVSGRRTACSTISASAAYSSGIPACASVLRARASPG